MFRVLCRLSTMIPELPFQQRIWERIFVPGPSPYGLCERTALGGAVGLRVSVCRSWSPGPDPGGAATVRVEEVGVDDADRLHERVHGGWSDKGEPLLAQGLGQGQRLG